MFVLWHRRHQMGLFWKWNVYVYSFKSIQNTQLNACIHGVKKIIVWPLLTWRLWNSLAAWSVLCCRMLLKTVERKSVSEDNFCAIVFLDRTRLEKLLIENSNIHVYLYELQKFFIVSPCNDDFNLKIYRSRLLNIFTSVCLRHSCGVIDVSKSLLLAINRSAAIWSFISDKWW